MVTELDQQITSDRDTARGGWLDEELNFTFRAVDPPNLLVSAYEPSNNAEMVLRDAPIVIALSEGVD